MSIEATDSEFFLPSSPSDRKKLKAAIVDASAMKQMVEDRKSALKDSINGIHENFNIPKKIVTKLVNTFHKSNYSEIVQESDQFSLAYETLFQEAIASADDNDEDESE